MKLDLDAGGIVLRVLHHLLHVLSFRAELVDELHEGLDDLGRLVGVVLAVVEPRRVVADHAVLANCRRTRATVELQQLVRVLRTIVAAGLVEAHACEERLGVGERHREGRRRSGMGDVIHRRGSVHGAHHALDELVRVFLSIRNETVVCGVHPL